MIPDLDRPDWQTDGADWPNRGSSRFVEAEGFTWHVQIMGPQRIDTPPVILLLHGTGASTHSWRDLMPLLARHFTVIAPDLPGHGFTAGGRIFRLSLPRMARLVNGLVQALDLSPDLVVGHSAGAAILLRMALDKMIAPAAIISLNGALMPFRGMAGAIFPPMAKLLFVNPLTPRLFAMSADRARVEKLIRDTGSEIDSVGIDLYHRLFRRPGHVMGALSMMANWDLEPMLAALPMLDVPLVLVVGEEDGAVSPADARDIQLRLPDAEVIRLKRLGHLAHEEDPAAVADIVEGIAQKVGLVLVDPA